MERVKVNLPSAFSFSTELNIRITDLNYGGHVGNQVFLSLIHEARIQFLQHFNYTELNFEGTSLIMADAAIEYKRELQHGDRLKISVAVANADKLGFDLYYQIDVIQGDTYLLAAKAKTGMLCFDYTAKKRVSFPQNAAEKMGLLQLTQR